jgi:hypothetical protein
VAFAARDRPVFPLKRKARSGMVKPHLCPRAGFVAVCATAAAHQPVKLAAMFVPVTRLTGGAAEPESGFAVASLAMA